MKDDDLEGPSPDDPKGIIALMRNTGTVVTSMVTIAGRMYKIEAVYIFGKGIQQTVEDLGKANRDYC